MLFHRLCMSAALLAMTACANSDSKAPRAPTPTSTAVTKTMPNVIEIPNATVFDGHLLGGQPTEEQLSELASAGYRTVINLRGPGEPGVDTAEQRTTALGMSYVHIPIVGAGDITRKNAQALDKALAETDGPAVIHCASGNRVGALFGLRARLRGASPEEAENIAKKAGVTSLSATVSERVRE